MKHLSLKNRCTCLPIALLVFCHSLSTAPAQNLLSSATSKQSAPGFGWRPDSGVLPIAVWLQSPHNAARFKEAGINLYVGLWNGPTVEQLRTLRAAGMPVICAQTELALKHKDDSIIAGWMHEDEPDNAQSLGTGQGYGPPVHPEKIEEDYRRLHTADPTRPVLLNLGQAVAWDDYIGRGVRRGHPEDYPNYLKGADIVSFDIYPVVHEDAAVRGRLEFVARGVQRLTKWASPQQIVWNCIECTHISNPQAKADPDQIRAEVWMSLIQGSRGLIYFVHQFKPEFKEAALLDDPENLAAVGRINAQVQSLAPVILSASPGGAVENIRSGTNSIASTFRQFGGTNYLFAVSLIDTGTSNTFNGSVLRDPGTVEVLGEDRSIKSRTSTFSDYFAPYGVHLYRWR